MKKILIFITTIGLLSCNSEGNIQNGDVNENSFESASIPEPIVNEFTTKYSGNYNIKVNGIYSEDSEAYVLREDGTARWVYMEGTKIDSEKSGTWSATETSISITCEGNSGPITEEFILKNGKFYDTLTGNRYLIKYE